MLIVISVLPRVIVVLLRVTIWWIIPAIIPTLLREAICGATAIGMSLMSWMLMLLLLWLIIIVGIVRVIVIKLVSLEAL